MGNFGTYVQVAVLSQMFDSGTALTGTTMFVGLLSAAPMSTTGSDFVSEPSAGGYARVAIGTASWQVVLSGTTSQSGSYLLNSANIVFPTSTSNWGTMAYIFASNTSLSGSGPLLWWCTAAASRSVLTGDTVTIGTQSLQVTLT